MWPCGRANQRGSMQESSVVWLRLGGWVGGWVVVREGEGEKECLSVWQKVCV